METNVEIIILLKK